MVSGFFFYEFVLIVASGSWVFLFSFLPCLTAKNAVFMAIGA